MCFALTRALICTGQIGKKETSPSLSVYVSHLISEWYTFQKKKVILLMKLDTGRNEFTHATVFQGREDALKLL